MPECKIACGECCLGEYPAKLMIYENLTKAQRDSVIKPRTKDKCCQTIDGKCEIHRLFGYEAKADICKNHLCERKE